jgi:indoleamine 2,3-dioxygenase
MEDMMEIYDKAGGDAGKLGDECQNIMELVHRQRDSLRKEVAKYCAERGVTSAYA